MSQVRTLKCKHCFGNYVAANAEMFSRAKPMLLETRRNFPKQKLCCGKRVDIFRSKTSVAENAEIFSGAEMFFSCSQLYLSLNMFSVVLSVHFFVINYSQCALLCSQLFSVCSSLFSVVPTPLSVKFL